MPKEVVQTLLQADDVRIERIISHGHASAPDFWYDQPQHEWVIVLKGAARLQFEDGMVEMKPGDFVNIPAHSRSTGSIGRRRTNRRSGWRCFTERAIVPIFECPTCGKQELVPLAVCEWMLDTVPYSRHDSHNTPVYTSVCSECSAHVDATIQQRPVVEIVEGDLLDQDVEVIVNAWNRNIIPWWLLLPQGVSGAIKRRGGTDSLQRSPQAWFDPSWRRSADFCGQTAIQRHHSCRRDQHAMESVGAVDSGFGEECREDCP